LTRLLDEGHIERKDVDFLIGRLTVENARHWFRLGERFGL